MGALLLATAGQYAMVAMFPIWAVSELDVSTAVLGGGLSAAGLLAGVGAPLCGRLSDRVGRRLVITAGMLLAGLAPLLLVGPVPGPVIGFGAFAMTLMGAAVRWGGQQALVSDLADSGSQEQGFAAIRVAYNVGASVGPLLGAVLVLVDFRAVFIAASLLSLCAVPLLRLVPDPQRTRATEDRSVAKAGTWSLLRSPVAAVVFGGSLLAWIVYQAFELLMPISLTDHGFPPYLWGLLFVINPVMVAVFQVRLVRWTSPIPRHVRLFLACLLLGVPFLLIPLHASVPTVALLIALFTIGEMSFGPANQAMIADFAPAHLRGVAMGLLSSTSSISIALTPGLGLGVRSLWGDTGMWLVIAGLGVVAGVLFFVVAKRIAIVSQLPEGAEELPGHVDRGGR